MDSTFDIYCDDRHVISVHYWDEKARSEAISVSSTSCTAIPARIKSVNVRFMGRRRGAVRWMDSAFALFPVVDRIAIELIGKLVFSPA